ncbi:glycosyltransferase [bacterium]|nr:glycosyltransferase [bacterium]
MRILYVHSTPIGSEQANLVQVLNMCNAFCRIGHKVTLITRRSDNRLCDNGRFIKEKFGMEVLFELVYFDGGFSIMGRLREIGALFSNVRKLIQIELTTKPYDLVFIRAPIFMPFVKKFNVPVTYELHNDIIHYDSRILNFLWERMLLRYSAAGIINKVVVISDALRQIWIGKGIDPDRLIVHHDGFNPAHYEIEITKEHARMLLGMPAGKRIVTYTGSLYQDRGIELILQSAQAVPDAHFYIVGGPTERVQYYNGLLQSYGIRNVSLIGRVDQKDVCRYLFASDVLLLIFTESVPTIQYCSPLKMFEYMASGRSILGHSFPTINEVLTHGQNSILADPRSSNDFIEKLKKLLSSDEVLLGMNARKLAFDRYTWEKRAEKLVQFLSS